MEITMTAGGVPPGTYNAEFVKSEPVNNQYGNGIRLCFRVVGGEHHGAECSRICSLSMSPKSALGRLAMGLKGSPIAVGERVGLASYLGAQGVVVVEATQNGGSRVATFFRNPTAQAAPAAPPTFAGQQPQPAWRPEAPQGPQPPAGPQPPNPQPQPQPTWGQPEQGTARF